MAKKILIYEKYLYPIWETQEFIEEIESNDGNEIKVLSPGELNHNSGPDFKNVKLIINNIIFVGDVEIDTDYSGWKNHGHNIDKNYNHVILHLVVNNPQKHKYVYSQSGRKIPTITLKKFLSMDFVESIQQQELTEEKKKYLLKCDSRAKEVDYFIREKFVAELGYEKYQKKVSRMKNRLLALKYLKDNNISEPKVNYELPRNYLVDELNSNDFKTTELWKQLFYEFIAEALGFTKNKDSMYKLSQLGNIDFISKIGKDENYKTKIQSLLFKVSGLFSEFVETDLDSSNAYQKLLVEYWKEIRNIYDSEYMNETEWQFFKMRPQNFPTIRIAALSKYLDMLLNENLIKTIFDLLNSDFNYNKIIKELQSLFILKSFGFWKNHYTFYKPAKSSINYFVGLNRADEIIVNVVLPFFGLYSEIFKLEKVQSKILKILNLYKQRNEYNLVNDIADILDLKKLTNRTLFSQGMLLLYRNYCSVNKCKECKIGREIFN